MKNHVPFGAAGAFLALAAMSPVRGEEQAEIAKRLGTAATTFSEIMATPDKGIPQDLLEGAHCAVIVPGVKEGAFIVGAKFGKGFVTCRKGAAGWSAPAAVRVEGGGVGFQIGGSETDLIMLVMNERGADRLLSSEFTLGGQGQVAAGPVGRNASAKTDGAFTAEILSWSRSRGLFAGISLEGATLREDLDANQAMYGKKLSTRDIVRGNVNASPAAAPLLAALSAKSPHEK